MSLLRFTLNGNLLKKILHFKVSSLNKSLFEKKNKFLFSKKNKKIINKSKLKKFSV